MRRSDRDRVIREVLDGLRRRGRTKELRWKFQRDAAAKRARKSPTGGTVRVSRARLDELVRAAVDNVTVSKRADAPKPPRVRPGPLRNTPHDRAVAKIAERPAVYRDGFLRSIGQALLVHGVTAEQWRKDVGHMRIIPDAFKIEER